jgi:hypothetical protein
MNKKKLIIIVSSALAVLVVGLLVNHFVEWPVDTDETSGDISKASRFSREMENEKLTNMEELLKNDSAFKDGVVAAQIVMQTRAAQFGTLVDMSNEVAGKLPAFAEVLKEMNATREVVDNVNKSLIESGQNLNAALGGEECADLEQTTINASLAYTTLQKQNKLATRFIETTDKYLEAAQGDDHLKFVRDQWLDYQKMTAALDGDKAAAETLAKKGNLLSGEKTLAAMADFGVVNQVAMINSAYMTKNTGIDGSLANALPEGALEAVFNKICYAAEVVGSKAEAINSQQIAVFNEHVTDAVKYARGLNDVQHVANQSQKVNSVNNNNLGQAQKVNSANNNVLGVRITETIKMFNCTNKVLGAYSSMINSVHQAVNQSQKVNSSIQQQYLGSQIGEVIKATAQGEKGALEMGIRGL